MYPLMAGRSGGQTIRGGTAASNELILESTSDTTKGNIILNPISGSVGPYIGVGIGITRRTTFQDIRNIFR